MQILDELYPIKSIGTYFDYQFLSNIIDRRNSLKKMNYLKKIDNLEHIFV